MRDINIFALVNGANVGDDDKALAVKSELCAKLTALGHKTTDSNVNITSSDELSKLHLNIKESKGYSIVLGGGEHSISPLMDINNSQELKGKVYTSWSGHHLFEPLFAAEKLINSIALPTHVDVSKFKEPENLIRTIGVVHNSKLDALRYEYEKVKPGLLPSSKYQFIYLAGDAPTPDGKTTLYYTPEEAYALGKNVGKELGSVNKVSAARMQVQ